MGRALQASSDTSGQGGTGPNNPLLQPDIDYSTSETQSTASHLKKLWQEAKSHYKTAIEPELVECQQLRNNKYTAAEVAAINAEGGTNIFKSETDTKCRTARALIKDIISPLNGRIWKIKPSPVPDLPGRKKEDLIESMESQNQEIIKNLHQYSQEEKAKILTQIAEQTAKISAEMLSQEEIEAVERSKRMEKVIADQVTQGGFYTALDDFIENLVTYPAAFLKGPIIRKKPVRKYKESFKPDGTRLVNVHVELEDTITFEAPSPFDMFTSPDCRDLQSSYVFERMKMTRKAIGDLKGLDGFNDDAIESVLVAHASGLNNNKDLDTPRDDIENRPHEDIYASSSHIEVLEFWGSLSGQMLNDWGLEDEIDEDKPTKEYEVRAWLVGNHVIHISLNPDPMGVRPYSSTSCFTYPGSLWGNGIAGIIKQDQKLLNVLVRAMVNNAALSALPQTIIDIGMLADGEEVTNIHPGRIWQYDSTKNQQMNSAGGRKAVEFFAVPSTIANIYTVYQDTKNDINEYSGIPSYIQGSGSTDAGDTASGMAMLMNSATKILRDIVRNLDVEVIRPTIERVFHYNMMYSEDADIKGDAFVVPEGIIGMFAKEYERNSLLQLLQTTANPMDMQIIGVEGRAAMIREIAILFNLDPDKFMKNEEEITEVGIQDAQMKALEGLKEQGILPEDFNPQQPEKLYTESEVAEMVEEDEPKKEKK